MLFHNRVIVVIKIIALQIGFRPDNIIIVETATPGRIDAAVVAPIKPHGRCISPGHIDTDISSSAFLHPGQFPGKI